MTRLRWPAETAFTDIELEPESRDCHDCGAFTHRYAHQDRWLHSMNGPLHVGSLVTRCPDQSCPGHQKRLVSEAEMNIAPPWWVIGWDVFAWVGHRRFARHWSVPQIRGELADSYGIVLSSDAIESYVRLYQTMVAAREGAPEHLVQVYLDVPDVVLSIDGLQPEKGHETLYVVRELTQKRVWFAEPLLSSSTSEIRRLFERAKECAERLGKPVRAWVSDKQKAFVTCIANVFPGVPHRYCANHFLRDLAKPVLEADSHAKVQMRRKVRGLRKIEQQILTELKELEPTAASNPIAPPDGMPAQSPSPLKPLASAIDSATHAKGLRASGSEPPAEVPSSPPLDHGARVACEIVLEYSAAVRGILNDDQGGPLHPPGLRMAEALQEVQASLQRSLDAKKGGPASSTSGN